MRIEALIIHSGGRICLLIEIPEEALAPRQMGDNYRAESAPLTRPGQRH